ncbi:MAG: alpha/beta hydrolase [Chloroflexi bacterium]|nr:alpha/beta hydrolase [Chloroflexota bacterium]
MNNVRRYGRPPFSVAVLHGGPGAAGQMAPVARELAAEWGVLEPLQTATSLEGQVEELRAVLEDNADAPVTLIGSSWGAMLGFILSARCPALVKKLIMVGSGVFEEHYAARIQPTRLSRLNEDERRELRALEDALNSASVTDKNALMARLGKLSTKSDAFDPLTLDSEVIEVRYDVFQGVWGDAVRMRRSGELLGLGRQVRCPVVAVHGDYDSHPREGVEKPLSAVVKNFRFILLEKCGHLPWIERQTRDRFFEILREELRSV